MVSVSPYTIPRLEAREPQMQQVSFLRMSVLHLSDMFKVGAKDAHRFITIIVIVVVVV
jgi:hypothetical protein